MRRHELESLEGERKTSMGGRGKHGAGVSTGGMGNPEGLCTSCIHWEGVLIPLPLLTEPPIFVHLPRGVSFSSFFFFSKDFFDLDHF